jgi:hypothetical protein
MLWLDAISHRGWVLLIVTSWNIVRYLVVVRASLISVTIVKSPELLVNIQPHADILTGPIAACQQPGNHERRRGVLGVVDADTAAQLPPASYDDLSRSSPLHVANQFHENGKENQTANALLLVILRSILLHGFCSLDSPSLSLRCNFSLSLS